MAKLIYSAITSLDGYVENEHGRFDWAAPDVETLAAVNAVERPIGTYLYGRRMYETMVFWETAGPGQSAGMRAFAEIWRGADEVVYSRTLQRVTSAKTRIEREFVLGEVRALKETSAPDIGIHVALVDKAGGDGVAGELGTTDHVQQPGDTGAVTARGQVNDHGHVLVTLEGVTPHVLIDDNDLDAVEPVRFVDQHAFAVGQDRVVGGLPRHGRAFGDPGHGEDPAEREHRPCGPAQPPRDSFARGRAAAVVPPATPARSSCSGAGAPARPGHPRTPRGVDITARVVEVFGDGGAEHHQV